jgi:hypothetical protein
MLEHFASMRRIAAAPERIEARSVTFADGTTVRPGLLLWATGYRANLSWIYVPRLAAVRNAHDMRSRSGGAVRSLDAPQLYFLGGGLEGIGSTSFKYALLCRSIMSHIWPEPAIVVCESRRVPQLVEWLHTRHTEEIPCPRANSAATSWQRNPRRTLRTRRSRSPIGPCRPRRR